MTHFDRAALALTAAASLVMAGCATQTAAPAPKAAASAAVAAPAAVAPAATSAKEFFVVLPEDGRVYAFGEAKTYFDYKAHGEVALTRTKIGAGPGGKTLVYGITNDDVKSNKPSIGEQLFEGKLPADASFYGEVFKDGRYYVFGNYEDMKAFTAFGEVPYSFTDIGAGPKGETLVWVMNKDSYAKGRPEATIAKFKAIRASK